MTCRVIIKKVTAKTANNKPPGLKSRYILYMSGDSPTPPPPHTHTHQLPQLSYAEFDMRNMAISVLKSLERGVGLEADRKMVCAHSPDQIVTKAALVMNGSVMKN